MWGDMDSLSWLGAGMAAAAVIALNWKALPFVFHLRCVWRIAASLWQGKLATIDEVRDTDCTDWRSGAYLTVPALTASRCQCVARPAPPVWHAPWGTEPLMSVDKVWTSVLSMPSLFPAGGGNAWPRAAV
jgi:hypothetical protein